jgi:hypothetical protein
MEQIEVGLHFLKDTFNVVPHIAWQIDPFGHSAYTPAIMNKYGIDTVYITRIGLSNKMYFKERGMLNFIWEGHPIDGKKSEIFVCLS